MYQLLFVLLGCPGNPTLVEGEPDEDGDGYRADVDCDDTDPLVNPAALDLGGDGVDRDCDGTDGGVVRLDTMPLYIDSSLPSENFGITMAVCDLNGDAQADLVVGSPGAARFDLFHGPLEPGDLESSMADVEVSLGIQEGFYLRCGDVDGDGRDDLLWSAQTVVGTGFDRIAVALQPPGGFTGSEDPVFLDLPEIDNFYVEIVALEGPGSEQLLLSLVRPSDSVEPTLYLVDGPLLTTDGVELEEVGEPVATEFTATFAMSLLTDLDGPGDDGVMICGNERPFCRIASDLSQRDLALDLTTTFDSTTGGRALVLDLDGTGTANDLLFSRWQSPGELSTVHDGLDMLQPAWTDTVGVSEGWAGGLATLGDLDSDGIDDVLLGTSSGEDDDVTWRIISGGLLADPPGQGVRSVSLLTVIGEPGRVNVLAAGDLDGDGVSDPVLSYLGYDGVGAVGVLLSSAL